jgi:hypothetical protein
MFHTLEVDNGEISSPIVNLGFQIEVGEKFLLFLGDIKNYSPLPPKEYSIIFVPVGGSKVFNADQALEFINRINHKALVVPIHYHGRADRSSGLKFKELANPYCEVKVLEVNESLEL